ncbi:MAG: protein kinase [Kouleothrix sp.]|nr:protein kinase [Kouleothrix sp.]
MLAPNAFVQNRYLIVREIGSGPISAVYEAVDMSNRTHVALKQLVVGADPSSSTRMASIRAEPARAGRQLLGLHHPALPRLLDYFSEGDSEFLVMEFIHGDDLAAQLERSGSPFPVTQVVRWAEQLLDALSYLHGQNPPVIHRDIRPQNLRLMQRGGVMLVDLGLRRGEGGRRQAKPARPRAGSPLQYMAPEQVRGDEVDQRSDLYSLAATLYYLVTGVLPALAGKRINAEARSHTDPLQPPHEINPLVPGALSTVLMRALALYPEWRYDSAATMRAALDRARATSGIPAPQPATEPWVGGAPAPAPPPTAAPPPPSSAFQPTAVAAPLPAATAVVTSGPAPVRRRWLLPAIASVVLIVVLLAFFLLRRGDAGEPEAQIPTAAPAALVATTQVSLTASAEEPTSSSAAGLRAVGGAAPRVAGVEPQSAFAGVLPLALVVRGSNLGQVREARLIPEHGPPIEVTLESGGADQLRLGVAALPAPLGGEVRYMLELDGVMFDEPAITLRDFVERKPVRGVLPEHTYTGRVATDDAGAYAGMRVEPNPNSEPVGRLRAGDTVDLLRVDVDGWYQVRVSSSADTAQVGAAGWVESWLVDNQDLPPTPTPKPTPATLVFVGRVYSTPTDGAVQCGAAFNSSIYGSVEDSRGRGVSGAKLRITSADGKNVYNVTTDRGGTYGVPGLGCTTWTVRLLSAPDAPGGIQANRVIVSNLNGGKYTSAEVRFRAQP